MRKIIIVALSAAVTGCVPQSSAIQLPERTIPRFEIFVLQPGYRGPFVAIYGEADGVSPAWRGDTGIYHVPVTGVLKIAHQEPPRATKAVHVFANAPDKWIGSYRTCADMRVHVPDADPRVCWLDFSAGGTGVPDHIVAVVTDWGSIPEMFRRTTVVYDSVLHGGTGKIVRGWTEPPDLHRRAPAVRMQ